MLIKIILLVCLLVKMSRCVPPIMHTDHLDKDEDSGQKDTMKAVLDQLEKWNNVYVSQIEPKIVSSSVTIANIDSNVRNLLERAHVWDTFQLHISAWNEQLATTDRKLDIISKGQEKMLVLDGKMDFLTDLEYKLETIFKKLKDTEEQLSIANKKLENMAPNRENLFGEFATRGILSTLKIIERKLDKVQVSGQSLSLKKQNNEGNKTLTIKCNTPAMVEELLKDISSKVDVIFDKMSAKDDMAAEFFDTDYLEDQEDGSGEIAPEVKKDADFKLLKKLLTRLNQPCKKTNQFLEVLVSKTDNIENNTLKIISTKSNNVQAKNYVCDPKNNDHAIERAVQTLMSHWNSTEKERDFAISRQFKEQEEHFEWMLTYYLPQYCVNIYNNSNHKIKNTSSTNNQIITTKISCDELEANSKSGLYILGPKRELNAWSRDYKTRLCEIREDGKWTVIQKRGEEYVPQNFSLSWQAYKNGFGNLHGDFWFGNEFIFNLTNEKEMVLRVELEDFDGNRAWAQYNLFRIGSEQEGYKLMIGSYKGNASDSFSSHNNSLFSTYDRKNDAAPECCPCAPSFGGGWWFNSCFEANLNGVYYKKPTDNGYYRGLIWEYWLGNYSLKKSKMMVRLLNVDDVVKIEPLTTPRTIELTTIPTSSSSIPFYEDP